MQTETLALKINISRYRKIIITAMLCIIITSLSARDSANFNLAGFGSGNGVDASNYTNSFAVHPGGRMFNEGDFTGYHATGGNGPARVNTAGAACSIVLSSAPGTNAQTVCSNRAITNITYTTSEATGATFSGLPAGVTGQWSANVVTISGTPTTTGTFNYIVTLTGGSCTSQTATGSIVVNMTPVVTITANPGAGPYCVTGPVLTANSAQCNLGVTFTAPFTNGVYTPANCTQWTTFRSQLTGSYTSLTISSSRGGTHTLSDPATVQNIANGLFNNTAGGWSFGGNTYRLGMCGNGIELSVNQFICDCANAISIRPCIGIGNPNWGGVNDLTCGAASQVLTVSFGSAGGGCTYLWNTGATTQSITPVVSGTYTVTVTTAVCSNTASYNVVIETVNTWTGTTSNNWFTAANWSCGIVPTAASDVLIPSAAPACVIPAGPAAQVHNLTIQPNASLTNNGTLNIGSGGVVTHSGNFTNNGIFNQ